MTGRKRLHISPFNAQILPIVLTPSLLHQASNISYHTIQSSPKNNYGYVDLPEIEADKLKKKLHGSVLKGSKMRVDLARHAKDMMERPNFSSESTPSNTSRRGIAKTREEGVIPGYELPTERKVKRGWTEPASGDVKSTKRRNDKMDTNPNPNTTPLTGKAEVLFKTTLPPNAPNAKDSKAGKVKKRKRGDSNRDVVVHEFANNTKHASFLRDQPSAKGKKATSEYIEGNGWVDEDGNTVEAEPKKRRVKVKTEGDRNEVGDTKSGRSRRSSKLDVPLVEVSSPIPQDIKGEPTDDETSSSSSSSDSESASEAKTSEKPPPERKQTRTSARNAKAKNKGLGISEAGDGEAEVDRIERLSITRSSATPPPVQEAPPTSVPATNGVNPLEALFKRPNNAASHTPKKPNLEVSTSFRFFDSDADEGESQSLTIPHTPFTQQDIRQRRQRSAAPTPDTAAPGKTFGDIWAGTSDVSDADEEDEKEAAVAGKAEDASTGSNEEKPESDFSKWFWEHRGETNRAWKRRRREAAKEKRQKENKERRG